MKFAVFALLFGAASAMKLTQHNSHQFLQVHADIKVQKNLFKKMLKTKDGPELDSEDEDEIEDWVEHELTTGDKTITKKEAHDAIAAFAKKKGWKIPKEAWEAMEEAFDEADTNGDGELDLDEVMAACKGEEDVKVPTKLFKKMIKSKDDDGPDSEEEGEIEAWAKKELTTGDKTITKAEAKKFFAGFAKKHGYKMTKEDWEMLGKMFDDADTNHDGELDLDEVVAACGDDEDIKLPKKLIRKFLKVKDDDEVPADVNAEIEAWATKELADGGTITGEEALKFFGSLAKKHGYQMKAMDWASLGYFFGQADTNHDGELDAAEVQAAMSHA